MRNKIFLPLIAAFFAAAGLWAVEDGSQVTVNFDTKEVSPQRPLVNPWQSDAAASIAIQVKEGHQVQSFPDVDLYELKEDGAIGNLVLHPVPQVGTDVKLRFRRCDVDIFEKYGLEGAEIRMCPFGVFRPAESYAGTWTIYSGQEVVSLVIDVYDPSQVGALIDVEGFDAPQPDSRGKHLGTMAPEIYVSPKPFKLNWSGGFAIFGGTDERYRIGAGDAGERTLLAASDGDEDFRLGVLANLVPYKRDWWGITVGLAANGELDELSLMLGPSLRLRTLPVVNDLYLTVGGAYAPVDRLKPAFVVGSAVPEDLMADDLVEEHREFMLFVSFSFGFWGSQEKFQALSGPK